MEQCKKLADAIVTTTDDLRVMTYEELAATVLCVALEIQRRNPPYTALYVEGVTEAAKLVADLAAVSQSEAWPV